MIYGAAMSDFHRHISQLYVEYIVYYICVNH